jgi:hypothetical protein
VSRTSPTICKTAVEQWRELCREFEKNWRLNWEKPLRIDSAQSLRGFFDENLVVAENHGGRYAVLGLEPEDILSRRILLSSVVVL